LMMTVVDQVMFEYDDQARDFEQATRTTRSRITSTSTSLTSRRSMSTRETSRRSTSAKDECDLEDDLGEVVEHNLKDENEVHLISYAVKV